MIYMKKIVSFMLVLITLFAFSVNVMATDVDFVPSITNKGAPQLVITRGSDGKNIAGYLYDNNGNLVSTEKDDCMVITSIFDLDKSKDIPKDAKDGDTREWSGKGLVDEYSGKAGNLILTFEFDDSFDVREEKRDLQNEMTNYWKDFLHELWSVNKMPYWKTYFAPDIPAQVLSNALYNIAENELRAKDVIAILDCSPLVEVLCGEGIIMTKDKIYINTAMGGWGHANDSKAVIDLTTLDDIWVEVKKKLLGQKHILHWTEKTKNGKVEHSYDVVIWKNLNLDKLVNNAKYIKKHYI